MDKADEQRCETCKEIKHISKFYKRINKKHEIHCKNCRNKQRDENHRYWKQQFIYKLSEYIELECVTCGYNKNFSALDFHHKRNKSLLVARELRNLSRKNFIDGRVENIIYEIIMHCEILCANCHREHHTKHIMKMKK